MIFLVEFIRGIAFKNINHPFPGFGNYGKPIIIPNLIHMASEEQRILGAVGFHTGFGAGYFKMHAIYHPPALLDDGDNIGHLQG